MPELRQLLSPLIYLFAEVDLGRAYIGAREAERACRHIVVIFVGILEHAQIDADGSWNEIGVAVTRATAVDGACVHAGSATNALKRKPVLLIGDDVAAPVVDEHHVHLRSRTRLLEVSGIGGGGLSRTAAA